MLEVRSLPGGASLVRPDAFSALRAAKVHIGLSLADFKRRRDIDVTTVQHACFRLWHS